MHATTRMTWKDSIPPQRACYHSTYIKHLKSQAHRKNRTGSYFSVSTEAALESAVLAGECDSAAQEGIPAGPGYDAANKYCFELNPFHSIYL